MRLAFVTPRFGADIGGGAETLARGFALAAAAHGWQVEAWTTCAQSHYTWANEHPAGESWDNGVRVLRFPVIKQHEEQQAGLEIRLATQGHLPRAEQYRWLEGGAHSPALYNHIRQQAASQTALLVMPYATPMMHAAAWCAPEKVIFVPCLHNEPYAYLEPVHLLLETVLGVLFNAPEEGELTLTKLRTRPRRHAVLGVGLPIPDPLPIPKVAQPPSLLLISRLEAGKNVPLVYDYMQRYWDNGGRVRLIVAGSGPLIPPKHPAFDFRGFISEEEKIHLCTTSLAVLQPSLNESFGITLLDSWLTGRPVLVHGEGAVTRGQVMRASGGLWFRDEAEFAAAIEWLLTHPEQTNKMGMCGRAYTLQNYTWPALINRFEAIWHTWQISPTTHD